MLRLTRPAIGIVLAVGFTATTTATTTPADAASAPVCFGRVPTVVLTNGDDHYTTKGDVAEVIWGAGGHDVIVSLGEGGIGRDHPGDYICGGPGNDHIFGDDGPDHINGGDGNDDVDGWVGNDVTQGNAGDDRVTDDPIDSNLGGRDTLRGGPGDDVLVNNFGPDKVYGNGGNDNLYDLECDATYLDGGAGSDYFESYKDSYGVTGSTCDHLEADGGVTKSPADTIIGGADFDRALLSAADKATGVERVSRAAASAT